MNKKVTMTLQDWLQVTSNSSNPLSGGDTKLLWEGLFIFMYKSDIPSTQAKMADQLASLIHCFYNKDAAIQFYIAFLETMSGKWCAIDQWHMHKWIMLIRRVTTECFVVLNSTDWDEKLIEALAEQIKNFTADRNRSYRFLKQFADIFLEGLAKATDGKVSKNKFNCLISPLTSHIHDGNLRRDFKSDGQSNFVQEMTNVETQPKKIKLSKAADKENVITVCDYWHPSLEEADARENEHCTSRSQQRKHKVNEANARWFRCDNNQQALSRVSVSSTSGKKSVKFMLQYNRSQEATEYFLQIINSPRNPYDGTKMPGKGLLKSNSNKSCK